MLPFKVKMVTFLAWEEYDPVLEQSVEFVGSDHSISDISDH
jgi:hypothetical protein